MDPSPKAALAELLANAAQAGELKRFTFIAYDREHNILYEYSHFPYSPHERLAVLSASKWISTAVILAALEKKQISLDQELISGQTFLRLLAYTSGLEAHHPSAQNPQLTLASSAQAILAGTANPENRFEYGDAHLQIAGYFVEKITGQSWSELFRETLELPLGLTSHPKYFAKPRKKIGLSNPRPAAGIIISSADYLAFMRMIWDFGRRENEQVLSRDVVERMERIETSPELLAPNSMLKASGINAGYGLGLWVEEANGPFGLVTSPGYYGFCPWMDRKAGYYALIVAEEKEPAFAQSIRLMADSRPMLERLSQNPAQPL